MNRHRLLERQLRRSGLGDAAPTAEQWHAFLEVIGATYAEADLDRDTLERSLTISSRELRDLYDNLARSSETQLASERDKLRAVTAVQTAVLDASRDGMLVIDPERRVAIYNRRFTEIWRIPPEVLATGDDHALLASVLRQLSDPMHFLAKVEELYANQTDSSEDTVRFTDGTILQRFSHPAIDAAGVLRGRLWVFRDVTVQREREADLYLAKERAESASRAKSDFLLNMSHEMRTPLNSILGFARVLQRLAHPRLTDDEREFLVDIVRAGDHMLQLINDLLDLRSLEAHALDIGPVELLPPLDEAARMVQPLLRERGHSFVVDTAPDLPACLGARRAIVQVLVNLLTNATKFTPERGRVELRAFRDGAAVCLQVCDTGVGIAPEDQARLFVYFEQLNAKQHHAMKGSGVGLALTRALVEKMGGTITVSSQVGKGTTFDIKLRAA